MARRNAMRVGAAAFVVGVSLGAPAVAAADGPDGEGSGSPSVAVAGSAGSVRQARSAVRADAARAREPAGAAAAPTAGSEPGRVRQRSGPRAAAAVRPNSSAEERPNGTAAERPNGTAAERPNSTAAERPDPVRSPGVSPSAEVVAGRPARTAAPIPAAAAVPAPVGSAGCAVCWGLSAPSLGQGIGTAVNHLFNSAFTWLSGLPANPLSDLAAGALVLIRRSLFVVPEGVTAAALTGTSLAVTVNTGSVAYFRQDGTSVQVSGDPWFFGAQSFADTTALTIVVNNPGNAGCAGLVLTGGTVNAALTTSQIDSLRFAAGAAFAGKVTATVSGGGALTLRDAVRGLGGVEFNAPLTLATDIEIDAGAKDATFNGTVDAARDGGQSLTVTALHSTIFAADVGATTPLNALTTRGIAPLTVADNADSKTIGLHYLPEFNTAGQAQVKYGIDVAIGDNPSQLYEFDTGGIGFFAGYNPSFWSNVPLTSTAVSETYSSGIFYDGVIANARITLGQGSSAVSTGQPIQIAAILNGGNPGKNPPATFDFTNPDAPPIEDHFFGDFGASLATLPVPGLDTPLANPLFQLPGNLSSGFLVRLGPVGIDPQLTVGVTDALRAQFPYAVPVTVQPDGGTYPVSGYDVLSWFGFAPAYTATQGDDTQQIGLTPTLPSLIDSGAPSTGVRLKNQGGDPFNVGNQLQRGTTFTAVFPTTEGRDALEWTFTAGDNGSVDLVNYEQGEATNSIQNVNTGLNLYNAFDVMFDIARQVIWLRPTGADATVTLQSVTTTGAQSYQQSAELAGTYATGGADFSVAGVTTLLGATVVDTGSGNVIFSGTVDADTGAESLTVNSGGTTTFARAVGGLAQLSGLTTNAGGSTATASVQTLGSQSYGDAVSLNGLYSVGAGAFTVAGATTLAGPVAVSGGAITFNGLIDSSPRRGYSLALQPGGGTTAWLNGTVGAANPIGGLTVQMNGTGAATVEAPEYVALAGDLGFSADVGLYLGKQVVGNFTGGGLIRNFTNSGVVIEDSTGTVIDGFTVSGNGFSAGKPAGDGIQLNGTTGTIVSGSSVFGNAGDGINAIATTGGEFSTNTVLNNGGDGVVINAGTGNSVQSNSIFANGGTDGVGIRLADGGNDDQPAPRVDSLTYAAGVLTLDTTVLAREAYTGTFTVQVFYSPATATADAQGQQLLGTLTGLAAGSHQVSVAAPATVAGGYLTLTATPESGSRGTSAFSAGSVIPA